MIDEIFTLINKVAEFLKLAKKRPIAEGKLFGLMWLVFLFKKIREIKRCLFIKCMTSIKNLSESKLYIKYINLTLEITGLNTITQMEIVSLFDGEKHYLLAMNKLE